MTPLLNLCLQLVIDDLWLASKGGLTANLQITNRKLQVAKIKNRSSRALPRLALHHLTQRDPEGQDDCAKSSPAPCFGANGGSGHGCRKPVLPARPSHETQPDAYSADNPAFLLRNTSNWVPPARSITARP